MDLMKILTTPAISFNLWGIQFEVNLIMGFIIVVAFAICYVVTQKWKSNIEKLKLNMQNPLFCPSCKEISLKVAHRSRDLVVYQCANLKKCNFSRSVPEMSDISQVSPDVKKRNRSGQYDTSMKL